MHPHLRTALLGASLQVLDDDGAFRGWVATEASLHGRYTGGALVAASYWVQP